MDSFGDGYFLSKAILGGPAPDQGHGAGESDVGKTSRFSLTCTHYYKGGRQVKTEELELDQHKSHRIGGNRVNVYVVGAGVSKTVGYPLGAELFDEIDKYVRESGNLDDRFDYQKDWHEAGEWFEGNENLLIVEAYRKRQIEHLFTILDLASILNSENLGNIVKQSRDRGKDVAGAESDYEHFAKLTASYRDYRRILLWAVESYFEYRHHCDSDEVKRSCWETLHKLGGKLCPGDTIITFNYDSTLERALIQQRKWSPRDGYGFELVFQESPRKEIPVPFSKSTITVLHLHGALGWYPRPVHRQDVPRLEDGGAVPRSALTAAPLETKVSLSPLFLEDLGISAVDSCLTTQPSQELPMILHPSFFKDYEFREDGGSSPFTDLWRKAATALREADKIFIVGYSLPSADSAVLTLLLTSCDPTKVQIINNDWSANYRLRQLLTLTRAPVLLVNRPALSLQEWLDT